MGGKKKRKKKYNELKNQILKNCNQKGVFCESELSQMPRNAKDVFPS